MPIFVLSGEIAHFQENFLFFDHENMAAEVFRKVYSEIAVIQFSVASINLFTKNFYDRNIRG